jgi:hypothetical protein
MIKKGLMNFAFEERADGKAENEHEFVFYAKLSDPAILEKATSKEDQEQWSFKFKSFNNHDVRMRVRKTTKDEKVEYVQTTKVFNSTHDDVPVYSELPIPTTEEGFNQFKLFCDNGMIKRRFEFPVTINDKTFTFEVDCYFKEDGSYQEWVKIDLELAPEETNLADWISLLPSGFTDIIKQSDATDEQKKFISELYSSVFLTKNTNV